MPNIFEDGFESSTPLAAGGGPWSSGALSAGSASIVNDASAKKAQAKGLLVTGAVGGFVYVRKSPLVLPSTTYVGMWINIASLAVGGYQVLIYLRYGATAQGFVDITASGNNTQFRAGIRDVNQTAKFTGYAAIPKGNWNWYVARFTWGATVCNSQQWVDGVDQGQSDNTPAGAPTLPTLVGIESNTNVVMSTMIDEFVISGTYPDPPTHGGPFPHFLRRASALNGGFSQ